MFVSEKVLLAVTVPATFAFFLYYWYVWRRDEDEDVEEEESKISSRQTVIDIKVPSSAVGAIIGRDGVIIKKIQRDIGCKIQFRDELADDTTEERVLTIRGTASSAQAAEICIRKIIADQPVIVKDVVFVPNKAIGRIIGKKGESIRKLQIASKTKIKICGNQDQRDSTRDSNVSIEITGTHTDIILARSLLEEKIEEEEEFRAKLQKTSQSRPQRTVTSRDRSKLGQTVQWPFEQDRYIDVYVSAIESPDRFWVQLINGMSPHLDVLQKDMFHFYPHTRPSKRLTDINNGAVAVGSIVVAPFSDDQTEMLYRAKVMEDMDDQVDLKYLDYGDDDIVDKDSVYHIDNIHLDFPYQAIECKLGGVRNLNKNAVRWSNEGIERMLDLTYCAKWKMLKAHRIGRVTRDKLEVPVLELIDTNGPNDVNIAEMLINEGLALPSVDESKQSLNGVNESDKLDSISESPDSGLVSDSSPLTSANASIGQDYSKNTSSSRDQQVPSGEEQSETSREQDFNNTSATMSAPETEEYIKQHENRHETSSASASEMNLSESSLPHQHDVHVSSTSTSELNVSNPLPPLATDPLLSNSLVSPRLAASFDPSTVGMGVSTPLLNSTLATGNDSAKPTRINNIELPYANATPIRHSETIRSSDITASGRTTVTPNYLTALQSFEWASANDSSLLANKSNSVEPEVDTSLLLQSASAGSAAVEAYAEMDTSDLLRSSCFDPDKEPSCADDSAVKKDDSMAVMTDTSLIKRAGNLNDTSLMLDSQQSRWDIVSVNDTALHNLTRPTTAETAEENGTSVERFSTETHKDVSRVTV